MRKSPAQSVYILDGARTVIGNPYKSLKLYTAAQLGGAVIGELVRRQGIRKNAIDQAILGNTVSAGAGQNVARQAVLSAGLANTTPALTVNNVCGSGLQSVVLGAQTILAQEGELVVCGGTESATHSPYIANKDDIDNRKQNAWKDSIAIDGLFCLMSQKRMGDLTEDLAKKNRISRVEQDRYALRSHDKAAAAQKDGKFRPEIVPLKDAHAVLVSKDDRPRASLTLEALSVLPPAFSKTGSLTSGNSSSPCDGAAAVILASEDYIQKNRIRPQARILGYASIATDPQLTFEAIPFVVKKCLSKTKLSLTDIDLFEMSEAFCAQMIYTKKKTGISEEKLNIWGGDVAFGHPLGAAGARILVTLMHALQDRRKKLGMACVAYGGGGALGMVIENLK